MTTILFADNDDNFLQTRKEFLIQEGWEVITANSPSEAKDLLESVNVDLAILDIRIDNDYDAKDKTGLELAHFIGSELPVIMLTGHPSNEYVQEALFPDNSAAVDFIAKEDGPEEFVKRVQRLLAKRRIFVIHGHNQVMNDETVDFIQNLRFEAIVLQKEAGSSKVIEHLERDWANVTLAVFIISDDDLNNTKAEPTEEKPCSCQNLHFELGYLIAKLGRSRVVLLVEEGTELPSDLGNLLITSLDDSKQWKNVLKDHISKARKMAQVETL